MCLLMTLCLHAKGLVIGPIRIRPWFSADFFLTDIGAPIADNKCFMFATDSFTRNFFINFDWDLEGLKTPCVNSFRDLGAHMNLARNHNGATLTQRLHKAAAMAKRLRWLPITSKMKERIVLCNIIPAGIYGIEAVRVSVIAFRHFRSAIANVLGPKSKKAKC